MPKKKVFVLSACLLLCAQTVSAEELLIQLKSGNIIKVKYEGVVQGVSLDGKTDAIEGFRIEGQRMSPLAAPSPNQALNQAPGQAQTAAVPAASGQPVSEVKPAKPAEKKDAGEGGWFKLKWAPPKSED